MLDFVFELLYLFRLSFICLLFLIFSPKPGYQLFVSSFRVSQALFRYLIDESYRYQISLKIDFGQSSIFHRD